MMNFKHASWMIATMLLLTASFLLAERKPKREPLTEKQRQEFNEKRRAERMGKKIAEHKANAARSVALQKEADATVAHMKNPYQKLIAADWIRQVRQFQKNDFKAGTAKAIKLARDTFKIVDPDNPDKSRPFVHFLMSTGFKVVQRPLVRIPDGGVRTSTSVSLAVDMLLQSENLDVIVLVSGDGNMVPAVEHLQKTGRRVELIAFTDRMSKDLLDSVDHFYPLHKIDNIERGPTGRDFDNYDSGDDGGEDGDGKDRSPEEL